MTCKDSESATNSEHHIIELTSKIPTIHISLQLEITLTSRVIIGGLRALADSENIARKLVKEAEQEKQIYKRAWASEVEDKNRAEEAYDELAKRNQELRATIEKLQHGKMFQVSVP